MKTILVDAIYGFVQVINNKLTGKDEYLIFQKMYELLEKYPNKKIILTGAYDEQMVKFGLNNMPYPVFTLKHNPEKTNPEYYNVMLKNFNLNKNEVIYFEHDIDAIRSAESVGINTYYYDKDKKDLESLKEFLDENLK
ncbi:hypothetical protein KKG24_01365 [Patescibacteria group bacterium]|nr:hypothetical protein [Patescibacteria group bacterium]